MTGILWAIMFAALPACPQEDSSYCAWDGGASTGAAGSFVDLAGTAYYADGSTMTPNGARHIAGGAR